MKNLGFAIVEDPIELQYTEGVPGFNRYPVNGSGSSAILLDNAKVFIT
jgi:hypothetical protein